MAFTISYVNVPLREITPASPSLKRRFGMIPIFDCPGDARPGQLGPITTVPLLRAYGTRWSEAWNGIRYVTMTWSLVPATTVLSGADMASGTVEIEIARV